MSNQPWPPSSNIPNPFSTHVYNTPEYPQYPPGHPRPIPQYPPQAAQPPFSQSPQYPPGHPLSSQQHLAYPPHPQSFPQNWESYNSQLVPGSNVPTQFPHPSTTVSPLQTHNAPANPGETDPAHPPAEEPNTKKRKRNGGKKQNTADSPPEALLPPAPSQPRKRARKTNTSTQADKEPSSNVRSNHSETPPSLSGVGPMTGAGAPTDNPPTSSSIQNPEASTADPTTQATPTSSSQGPSASQGSQSQKNQLARAASDCWAFLRPLETKEKPTEMPDPETEEEILSKPSSPWVGCKLCREEWMVWKCGDGMTSHYRNHLASRHWDEWVQLCKKKKILIKGRWATKAGLSPPGELASTDGSGGSGKSTSDFSLEGFLARLVQWLVSDDQSVNVIENRFFRELLVYVSNGNLDDEDIPHRTKVTSLIKDAAVLERQHMEKEMQNSEGRISFTSDLWSDPSLTSYMAVTAHYCFREKDGRLVLRSRLCAFRHITGRHTGANLGKALVDILKELGVLRRLGYITLDNASNCDTLADQIAEELEALHIGFSREQNRLRCFPHVVNLAVQDFLNNLSSEIPTDIAAIYDGDDLTRLEQLLEEESFAGEDIIHRIRGLVAALRVSGQRRESFRRVLVSGNAGRLWDDALEIWKTWWVEMDPELRTLDTVIKLPVVQLLRDCPTRWSSSFVMLHRFLELYPAINQFVNTAEELSKFKISRSDIERLINIHHALSIPHAAQQLLSYESTPTLSLTLPVYESLVSKWEELKLNIPELQVPLTVGIKKIREYITKTRKSDVYALAMAINPTMKLEWVQDHWGAEEAKAAEKVVRSTMLAFRTASRRASTAATQSALRPLPIASPSRSRLSHAAARSQGRGLANFLGILTARRTGSLAAGSTRNLSASTAARPPSSESEAAEIANDELLINSELLRYTKAGVMSGEALDWKQENRFEFPTLYKIALDTIPVQASSVPCERAFSSSKETVTLRRNRLSPEFMEALQILKHTYHRHLNFTGDLVTDPETLRIDDEHPSESSNPPLMLELLEQCLGEDGPDDDSMSGDE